MKIKTTRRLSYKNEAGELVTIPADVETDHFDDEKALELIGRGAALVVLSDVIPPETGDEDELPPEDPPKKTKKTKK